MRLQLLPQAQAESQRDILFRQLVAERRAPLVPAMAGVHHHEILHWSSELPRAQPLPAGACGSRTAAGAAAGGAAGACACGAACGAGVIVMVRPSLLKLANSGTGPFTAISAAPLFS